MPQVPARALAACLLAISVCGGFAASASAQERREIPEYRVYGDPSHAPAIEALINGYRDAWGREDAAAYLELHAADTEWMNAFARIFQGTEALGDFLENRLFPQFDDAIARQDAENMRTISVRYMGDSGAVVHLYTESQRGDARDDRAGDRRVHIHLVLEMQQSAWKIVHTAIMDAR